MDNACVLLHSHENTRGYYRVSAYFIGKVLIDIIPMRLLPLCALSLITYFMVGKLHHRQW